MEVSQGGKREQEFFFLLLFVYCMVCWMKQQQQQQRQKKKIVKYVLIGPQKAAPIPSRAKLFNKAPNNVTVTLQYLTPTLTTKRHTKQIYPTKANGMRMREWKIEILTTKASTNEIESHVHKVVVVVKFLF